VNIYRAVGAFLWSLLAGCSSDKWEAFIYPNSSDLTQFTSIGPFQTFEACQQSAINVLKAFKPGDSDYECGKNCEISSQYGGMNVCEETMK